MKKTNNSLNKNGPTKCTRNPKISIQSLTFQSTDTISHYHNSSQSQDWLNGHKIERDLLETQENQDEIKQ